VIHRYVDDAAPASPQQMGNDLAGDQEVAGQVGGDYLYESRGSDLPKWLRAGEELGWLGLQAGLHAPPPRQAPVHLHRGSHDLVDGRSDAPGAG